MLGALGWEKQNGSFGKVRILGCFYHEKVLFLGPFRTEKVRDRFSRRLMPRKGESWGNFAGNSLGEMNAKCKEEVGLVERVRNDWIMS